MPTTIAPPPVNSAGPKPAPAAAPATLQQALAINALGVVWAAVYGAAGEGGAAAVIAGYLVVMGLLAKRLHDGASPSSILLALHLGIITTPVVLTHVLGGIVNSSGIIVLVFLAPIGALLLTGRRSARFWLAVAAMALTSTALWPGASARPTTLAQGHLTLLFALNVGSVVAVMFVLLQRVERLRSDALLQALAERERAEALLRNVLPADVAEALSTRGHVAAQRFDAASVLFADVVGFTDLSARLAPEVLVRLLDDVFTGFDQLVAARGLEKVKTIGDCYMVAAGVPRPRADHADALAGLALDMQAFVRTYQSPAGIQIVMRIGINSGPVVAGVIGRTRFIYDLWGDTVNTASRMESLGEPGRVHISPTTRALLGRGFHCVPRGTLEVKGKGAMNTWFLEATAGSTAASATHTP